MNRAKLFAFFDHNRLIFLLAACFCVALFGTRSAVAVEHPTSLVEAEIYVTKSKLTMRLKCFAEDLELLQGVEPYEETGKYDNQELKDGTKDHAEYLLEKIQILNTDGEQIEGKVTEISDFEIPEEGIAAGKLMNFAMGYVMEYTYDSPPEFVTINQQMIADGALLPSELKILMKQAGSDVPIPHMMKPNMPKTFQFDWEKPPLQSDSSDADWNAWFDEQREKNLGIESYGSVYSFLYITRRDVRLEVLIPLASLATMMEVDVPADGFLTIEQQDELKPKIEALFTAANPIKVDGELAKPKVDSVDFYGLNLRDFAMKAERRKVSMASGRMGIIMSHSAGTPNTVELTWDMFNDVVRSVDLIAVEMDEVRKVPFTKFLESNNYQWTNESEAVSDPIHAVKADFQPPWWPGFPWLSVVCFVIAAMLVVLGQMGKVNLLYLIAGALTTIGILLIPFVTSDLYGFGSPRLRVAEEADGVFASLHENLFRSFDKVGESEVYDALKQSVDGRLLRELYLDFNETLKIQEQGGAVANVEQVRMTSGKQVEEGIEFPSDQPGFSYRSEWDLLGTIEHWGHVHERTNRYDVVFDVQVIEGQWKITAMRPQRPPEGVVKTRVRTF